MQLRVQEGQSVELRVTDAIGWVPGVVTYVGSDVGLTHCIVDTEKHGRFAVSRGHEDLRSKGGK